MIGEKCATRFFIMERNCFIRVFSPWCRNISQKEETWTPALFFVCFKILHVFWNLYVSTLTKFITVMNERYKAWRMAVFNIVRCCHVSHVSCIFVFITDARVHLLKHPAVECYIIRSKYDNFEIPCNPNVIYKLRWHCLFIYVTSIINYAGRF